jgi:hypothetical protein
MIRCYDGFSGIRAMFSFSFRWLWAQSLTISAGLFLLGYMTLPKADAQLSNAGHVSDISVISRKGLGSYYELILQTDSGRPDRVLIRRNVADESVVRGLIGHRVSAHVNWSSDATDLQVEGDSRFDANKVRQSAESIKARYDLLAVIFAGAGIALGLLTLAFWGNRRGKFAG